jgi:hypothetical protein
LKIKISTESNNGEKSNDGIIECGERVAIEIIEKVKKFIENDTIKNPLKFILIGIFFFIN